MQKNVRVTFLEILSLQNGAYKIKKVQFRDIEFDIGFGWCRATPKFPFEFSAFSNKQSSNLLL